MERTEIFEQLSAFGIVPVVAVDDAGKAVPLAGALVKGGLPVIEVTFRTTAAGQVIRALSRECPDLITGAGTVLTEQNLREAKATGARFAVAPGLNSELVALAAEIGLPFIPGVATASEVERALSLGCRLLKFFPAELLGGVKMIDALSGPYGHTGVKFIPTGGVTQANLEAYLRCKSVAAVGGTWLARKEDLTAASWDEISDRCAAAVQTVAKARATR